MFRGAHQQPVTYRWCTGVGHTVAIDESVVAKTKPGNVQARPVPPQWVFGGVDLGTGEFFMEVVPQRMLQHCKGQLLQVHVFDLINGQRIMV